MRLSATNREEGAYAAVGFYAQLDSVGHRSVDHLKRMLDAKEKRERLHCTAARGQHRCNPDSLGHELCAICAWRRVGHHGPATPTTAPIPCR